MEFLEFAKMFASDESFKAVGLVILWQMKTEMKSMKEAINTLASKMSLHEIKQDERWSNHETRLVKVESHMEVQ